MVLAVPRASAAWGPLMCPRTVYVAPLLTHGSIDVFVLVTWKATGSAVVVSASAETAPAASSPVAQLRLSNPIRIARVVGGPRRESAARLWRTSSLLMRAPFGLRVDTSPTGSRSWDRRANQRARGVIDEHVEDDPTARAEQAPWWRGSARRVAEGRFADVGYE